MALLKSFARICPANYKHPDLLGYMAESSRTDNFDSAACYKLLHDRVEFAAINQRLEYTPQERNVFKVRFDTFANSNEAYTVGTMNFDNLAQACPQFQPYISMLENFSRIRPCWSLLFPLKMFLLDRPSIAKDYHGFLPFGSEVLAWLADIGYTSIGSTPTLEDHIFLADYSLKLAKLHGWSTVTVNHHMYIEGKALAKKKVIPEIPPVGE